MANKVRHDLPEARWPNANLTHGGPATAHGGPLSLSSWATTYGRAGQTDNCTNCTRLREGVRSMLQAAPPEPPRPPSRYDALLDDLPSYAPEDEDDGEHARESVDAHDDDDRPSRTLTRVAHELAPVIREMAADLSGTVVGTLEIDLEDRPGPQRDGQHRDQERDDAVTNDTVTSDAITNDTGVSEAVSGTVAPEDAAVVPPAPQPARREAVVVQLPLRTMDSSVD